MRLVVGLGNPGEKYRFSRHNIGFMSVDFLVAQIFGKFLPCHYQKKVLSETLKYKDTVFAKPQTFMNSSGLAVKKLVNFYKVNISDLWIIHDDLDIKLGQYKIQRSVGPKLHNGIESVENLLGKTNFWRVRIGVDNRDTDNRISGEEYVLQNFTGEERKVLSDVIAKVCDDLKLSLKIFKA
jgi:PTH1 family peptidyl-tRNA hydrolase